MGGLDIIVVATFGEVPLLPPNAVDKGRALVLFYVTAPAALGAHIVVWFRAIDLGIGYFHKNAERNPHGQHQQTSHYAHPQRES